MQPSTTTKLPNDDFFQQICSFRQPSLAGFYNILTLILSLHSLVGRHGDDAARLQSVGGRRRRESSGGRERGWKNN